MTRTPEQLKEIFRMERKEAEREFAPYFYQYFKRCFDSPATLDRYSQSCKHFFDMVQAKEKKVLDIGCGFGLISIHLATFGAQIVSGVDANEEAIYVFQKILSRFSPPLSNVEVKLGDALNLDYEDNHFDVVVANEVISHVRDVDFFIREMRRVLRPGGIFYISDSNNAWDIVGRYRRRKFWRGQEYGPVDETSIRGTEKPIPWLLVRREMILGKSPQLGAKALDLLAKETAGMYGDEIFRAVEEYLTEGQVLNKPAFKFRDPVTGEYNEFEFVPYLLKRKLERSGFSARIVRPYFPLRPLHSVTDILINLAVCAIAALHPLSTMIAPAIELVAIKKTNDRKQ